jgi:hypothetical protein
MYTLNNNHKKKRKKHTFASPSPRKSALKLFTGVRSKWFAELKSSRERVPNKQAAGWPLRILSGAVVAWFWVVDARGEFWVGELAPRVSLAFGILVAERGLFSPSSSSSTKNASGSTTSACVYVCMYVCMYVWLFVCDKEFVWEHYVRLCICMYVSIFVCMHVSLHGH